MSNKTIYWYAKLVVICLSVVMFTIPMSFAVKNILFERMGVCEPWMEFFMRGDTEFMNALEGNALDEENGEVTVEIDWEAEYPFQVFDGGRDVERSGSLWNLVWSGVDQYEELVQMLEENLTFMRFYQRRTFLSFMRMQGQRCVHMTDNFQMRQRNTQMKMVQRC